MSRRRDPSATHGAPASTPSTSTPLGSYLVRVLELREVRVRTVYELQDIGSGQAQRFESAAALQRWLADRH